MDQKSKKKKKHKPNKIQNNQIIPAFAARTSTASRSTLEQMFDLLRVERAQYRETRLCDQDKRVVYMVLLLLIMNIR